VQAARPRHQSISIPRGVRRAIRALPERKTSMKDGIHPKYQDCVVSCGCGNTFKTRSTKAKIAVEVCSRCHPFYTGTVKFVDAAGRVDKFNKKFQGTYGKAKKETAEAAAAKS
jgi:large subunit ribosomal protein L31